MSAEEKKKQTATEVVDIFSFDSCRDYLKAELLARKNRHRGASLRQLSRRAGFSSPSILSMIVTGRRPMTARSVEKLAAALYLHGRQKKYFLTLSKIDSAKSETELKQYRNQLMQIKAMEDETVIEVRQYRLLSEWYYSAIYVMVGQQGFKADPEWIQSKLRSPVTTEQIQLAIDTLLKLGLIQQSKTKWIQTHGAITTAEHIKDFALFAYHRKMIELSQDALEQPSEDREYNGATIAIPKNQMPWVKDKIRQLRKELNEHLSQFEEPSDIFQINLNLFALTKGLEDK